MHLPTVAQKSTATFTHKYGADKGQELHWKTLGGHEDITEDLMGDDNYNPIKKDILWNPDTSKMDCNHILFENFLPDLKGKEMLWINT